MDSGLTLFDSHAHLDAEFYGEDLDAVIDEFFASGGVGVVNIGSSSSLDVMERAVKLARQRKGVHAAVGIHPHEADTASSHAFEALEALLGDQKVVAVGEAGLDYHYSFSSKEGQLLVFERQVRMAREIGLPLAVHCRDAHRDCLELLSRYYPSDSGGVIHCFTGGPELARQYLELGFMVSIPGVVTFKNARRLPETVKTLPLDRVLVETDAPFLAPVPHRGKKNRPSFVRYTIEAIASLRGETRERIASVTAENAMRFFRLRS